MIYSAISKKQEHVHLLLFYGFRFAAGVFVRRRCSVGVVTPELVTEEAFARLRCSQATGYPLVLKLDFYESASTAHPVRAA